MNENRAGHVWVGRRDSPAAETDATVVRLNFFCQAPPRTGQKQTQMLVASVCVCVCVAVLECACVNRKKEHCLIRYQALTGAHTSRAVIVYCSIPSTFLLCSPSHPPISISHHQSSRLFLVCLFSLPPSLPHLSLCSKAGSHCSEKKKDGERGWRHRDRERERSVR